ncbi:MAG: alpha/beta fold hydrolase [Actinomycetes bacterium]
MDHVEVEGLRIAYERAGSGPALVLLHGFVGDGRSTWSTQLDELSEDFTVIAWDAPGAGGSPEPPEWFRSPDYADCLARFVGALHLTRPSVVGLSFGGILALELFGRHPHVPGSLVLASAYAGWAGYLQPDGAEERLRFCLRVAELPPRQFVDEMLPSMFFDPAAEGVSAFAESIRGFNPAGFRTMARALAEADLRDVLGRIDLPTLLLYGERDVRAPVAVGKALRDFLLPTRPPLLT